MRIQIASVLVLVFCWSSFLTAAEPDFIQPGMLFSDVKATLQKHRYEVDAKNYGLAIASSNKDELLDFCQLDADATLVIGYSISTKKVNSLDIWYVSNEPKSQRHNVVLKALKISFEDVDTFTVKVKRAAKPSDGRKVAASGNPFE